MDLTLTEDQRLITSTARELLDSRAAVAGARAVAGEAAGYSAKLWKEMTELGWTGLAFGEEYGGVGLGFGELCLVIEELGRARVPSPLVATVACCGMPIGDYGTEDQKSEWLGAIADGQVMTYALGAGGVLARRGSGGAPREALGSDPGRSPGSGDGFVLDGEVPFVPYADSAARLLVTARHDGEPIAAVVDTAAPGVSAETLDVVGDPMSRVRFANVAVPADRVLGDGAAAAVTAYGTAAVCAEMAGGAQGVLDMTVAYAREREQFGKPVGAFQAVAHHCADMAIDVLSSRLAAYEAIWRLAGGLDATMELSLAKSWVSEAYQRVCALGHQVHGAIGFTAEHDLHYFYRHAMSSALAFGDADFHVERVAANLGI
ncbi:MAG: acyl-CoA/acyl-ACP dehydrogenase [Nocardiopsaceae bacterium]|nr:acyl-CoA/acyl-ACP dehydrogenase [Nocardiopsaceae bacterium]